MLIPPHDGTTRTSALASCDPVANTEPKMSAGARIHRFVVNIVSSLLQTEPGRTD